MKSNKSLVQVTVVRIMILASSTYMKRKSETAHFLRRCQVQNWDTNGWNLTNTRQKFEGIKAQYKQELVMKHSDTFSEFQSLWALIICTPPLRNSLCVSECTCSNTLSQFCLKLIKSGTVSDPNSKDYAGTRFFLFFSFGGEWGEGLNQGLPSC
jgi:hypothetical protein